MFNQTTAKLAVVFAASVLIYPLSKVTAQDSVYSMNGSNYQNVTQTVRTPVAATHMEDREQTVYRQQMATQIYESQRNVLVPISEYQWQPKWHGRLNPFRPATVAYHLVPQTRWEMHTQTVQTPVTRVQWVPEKRLVQVPVTTLRIEDREQVVLRPAANQVPVVRQAGAISRKTIGSVARMESDPPRRGSALQSQAGHSILR